MELVLFNLEYSPNECHIPLRSLLLCVKKNSMFFRVLPWEIPGSSHQKNSASSLHLKSK